MVAVAGNINGYDATLWDLFDSTALIASNQISGTGGRLAGTNYVLTAAHVAEGLSQDDLIVFTEDTETAFLSVGEINLHPEYRGIDTPEFDLALLQMRGQIPSWVPGYELYESPIIFGKTVYFAGFGLQGSFGGPVMEPNLEVMPKAWASNMTDFIRYNSDTKTYDNITPSNWDEEFVGWGPLANILRNEKNLTIFDFDSGLEQHNLMPHSADSVASYGELGVPDEGIPMSGDSGSPILIGDPNAVGGFSIIGVVAQGFTSFSDPDWSSFGDFGELSVNAKPADYSGWINWVTNGSVEISTLVSTERFSYDGFSNLIVGSPELVQTIDIDITADEFSTSIYDYGKYKVVDTGESLVRLENIERLGLKELGLYSDYAVAFDIDGTAGEAYRLYEAAFDRQPDLQGLGFWISQMDAGLSLKSAAEYFISSEEFISLYGKQVIDPVFVDTLYLNILGRLPDAEGRNFWTDQLGSGLERSNVLIGFSESNENKLNVLGVISNGIGYEEYSVGF